jgi:ferredoxin
VKRDPTAARGSLSRGATGRVFFQASNVSAPVLAGGTILDAADQAGVLIDNACRSGTCGSCRVKLVSGAVHMPVQDALTDDDRTEGYILACQAETNGDVVADA